MLYLDGKGALLARLDHTLEEAKKHEFSEFILDKRFHEQDEIIQNEINRERNKSTFKERMDGQQDILKKMGINKLETRCVQG
jgi:hypothetical protein